MESLDTLTELHNKVKDAVYIYYMATMAARQLHDSPQFDGPHGPMYKQVNEDQRAAYKAILNAFTPYMDYVQGFTGTLQIPPQVLPAHLPIPIGNIATTDWVQQYVQLHLVAKQPTSTTRSWSPADLAITVLSGVLGGLIVTLLGAGLLLILP